MARNKTAFAALARGVPAISGCWARCGNPPQAASAMLRAEVARRRRGLVTRLNSPTDGRVSMRAETCFEQPNQAALPQSVSFGRADTSFTGSTKAGTSKECKSLTVSSNRARRSFAATETAWGTLPASIRLRTKARCGSPKSGSCNASSSAQTKAASQPEFGARSASSSSFVDTFMGWPAIRWSCLQLMHVRCQLPSPFFEWQNGGWRGCQRRGGSFRRVLDWQTTSARLIGQPASGETVQSSP